MKFVLCHLKDEPSLGEYWKHYFSDCPDVEIHCGSILDVKNVTAVVSPANSFGFMTGGLDQVYTDKFGPILQTRLQEQIKKRPLGELLVGEYLVIPTDDTEIPYIISAPTMRVPSSIGNTVNPYLAMKAILLASIEYYLDVVAIPGLGTGNGMVTPNSAAYQMKAAYSEIMGSKIFPRSISEAHQYEHNLKS